MVTIERFDPAGADLTGYHAVLVASQAADRPEEPPLPPAELAGRLAKPLPGMGPAAH